MCSTFLDKNKEPIVDKNYFSDMYLETVADVCHLHHLVVQQAGPRTHLWSATLAHVPHRRGAAVCTPHIVLGWHLHRVGGRVGELV